VRGSLCETNPVGRGWTASGDGIHEIRTVDGKGINSKRREQE